MLKIPLQAVPSQTLNVLLGGQQTNIKIYTLPQRSKVDQLSLFSHDMSAEQFGLGNGQTTRFYLAPSSRIVQRVVSLTVYVDSVATAATVSANGYVTFASAPATGAILTATGEYTYRNRAPAFEPVALFADVSVNNAPIVSCVSCFNLNKIVRSASFIGDLFFNDTKGTSDPDYTGLADRFELIYQESL